MTDLYNDISFNTAKNMTSDKGKIPNVKVMENVQEPPMFRSKSTCLEFELFIP